MALDSNTDTGTVAVESADAGQSSWEDSIGATLDAITAEPDTASEAQSRQRDERGRFASAATDESQPLPDEQPSEQLEQVTETQADQAAPVWKPASWKPEELQGWETLPPHARAAIERRETEINRGLQEAASERQIARTIKNIVEPFAPHLQSAGIDPIKAFQESLHVFSQLQGGTHEQRVAMVRNIAQRYGVPLGDAQEGAQQQAIDPVLSATQQQLAALQQQVTRWQTSQQQAEQQQAISQVEAFGKDSAHAHFDAVRGAMADLIQSGTARDLQDAYDKAIWLVPEVRTKIISETEQKRQQEAARKATEAKRAGAVNVQTRGAPNAQAPKAKHWADDLSRIYDEVTTRT